jgi:hypothetical protein
MRKGGPWLSTVPLISSVPPSIIPQCHTSREVPAVKGAAGVAAPRRYVSLSTDFCAPNL